MPGGVPDLPNLEALETAFHPDLLEEGELLHGEGAVHLKASAPGSIKAHIDDRPPCETFVEVRRDTFRSNCTCALGRRGRPCPHVWAVLVAAAEGPVSAPSPATRNDAGLPWEQALRALNPGSDEAARRPGGIPASQIIYYADLATARQSGELRLNLASRKRLKRGGWSVARLLSPGRIPHRDTLDEEDRPVFELLLGSSATFPFWDASYRGFPLSGALLEVLLPRLCRTGRFFLWSPDSQDSLPEPCAWDDGPPWILRFQVEARKNGRGDELWGSLDRDGETMDLSEPDLFVPDSIVFARGKAARFLTDAEWQWIPLLRNAGPVRIPRKEADRFAEELLKSPTAGAGIELPESLRPRTLFVPPRPRLRLDAPGGARNRLGASLSFEYGEFSLRPSPASLRYYSAEQRTLILRDLAAEREAQSTLSDLGFRAVPRLDEDEAGFELDATRLPDAVAALTDRGWIVQGEAGLFRRPGRFRISVSSGIDWFDLEGGVEYGDTVVPFPRLLAALRSGERFVPLGNGAVGLLPEEWLRRHGLALEAGQASGDALRYRPGQALLLDVLLEAEKDTRTDVSFDRLRERIRTFERIEPRDPPDGFQGALRPYQRLGLGWLEFLETVGLGGRLADDMGLGKTVQVLAWFEARRARRAGPSLVVVPRSLLFNWKSEAARFTPSLRVLDHHGTGRPREGEKLADADLVLTTYGTLRRDAVILKDVRFDAVVLDEAQAIKNALSATAKAARLLKANHRVALSGTPIENHLGELWSLLEFLNPGMLGKASAFRAAVSAKNGPDGAARAVLARALRPILLRRTKGEVAPELPSRVEQTLAVELDPKERARYEELREHYRRSLLRKDSKDWNRSKMHVLEALLRLRQAACHPGLLDPDLRRSRSAKLETLLDHLREVIAEGHKALVFSQFTSLLAIVKEALAGEGIVFEYLDGQTRGPRPAVPGGSGLPRVSREPQGGRPGTQPDRRGVRLPPRSLVEPGRGGAGDRPDAPDRPEPVGVRLPPRGSGHRRGKDPRAPKVQARAGGRDPGRRQKSPGGNDARGPGAPALLMTPHTRRHRPESAVEWRDRVTTGRRAEAAGMESDHSPRRGAAPVQALAEPVRRVPGG